MQSILAIETSQASCAVAIRTSDGIQQLSCIAERKHGSVLLPMVAELLDQHGVHPSELDSIAFGCGPGSFTGARIAASVAQGLAFGSDASVVPVSSLRALSHTAAMQFDLSKDAAVFVAVNAHMDEIYCACYRNDSGMSAIQADALLGKQDAGSQLMSVYTQFSQLVLVGNGVSLLELPGVSTNTTDLLDSLMAQVEGLSADCIDLQPSAASILQFAEQAIENGDQIAPEQAVPAYLRGRSAWKKMKE
ncbi:MAG: tRNA (adenosine(37)-N6)-threonylcarbamoyltransferase complex dimerization subunit type 1 TsaB [Pseudomonadales bacterium]